MRPEGFLAVEALVRTPAGEPAAAATGWFAGVDRCGLIEPVGTHPDLRGHGYGRDAVLGACAALAHRGASAVTVATPSTNNAAVALYRSAGFTVARESRDWVRVHRYANVLLNTWRSATAPPAAAVAKVAFHLDADLDGDEDAELDHAVAVSASAKVAIVVIGTTDEVESEGFDRTASRYPAARTSRSPLR